MKTIQSTIRLVVGLPLLYIAALASVGAQPVVLDDHLLNEITAGVEHSTLGGSGGAIVGNSSEATISRTGGVESFF